MGCGKKDAYDREQDAQDQAQRKARQEVFDTLAKDPKAQDRLVDYLIKSWEDIAREHLADVPMPARKHQRLEMGMNGIKTVFLGLNGSLSEGDEVIHFGRRLRPQPEVRRRG